MNQKRSCGFTIAELLVAIAIIAVLAAITMPVMNAAIERGEMARARSEIAGISAAIKSYYKEYGKFPCLGNGSQDSTYLEKGALALQNEVMDILRARDTANNSSHSNNTRRIIFLSVPDKSMTGTDRNGASYNVSDGYFLDPWGNPYGITMDTDFDQEVGISGLDTELQNYVDAVTPASGAVVEGEIAAVVSYGPPPYTNSTKFLLSWTR